MFVYERAVSRDSNTVSTCPRAQGLRNTTSQCPTGKDCHVLKCRLVNKYQGLPPGRTGAILKIVPSIGLTSEPWCGSTCSLTGNINKFKVSRHRRPYCNASALYRVGFCNKRCATRVRSLAGNINKFKVSRQRRPYCNASALYKLLEQVSSRSGVGWGICEVYIRRMQSSCRLSVEHRLAKWTDGPGLKPGRGLGWGGGGVKVKVMLKVICKVL